LRMRKGAKDGFLWRWLAPATPDRLLRRAYVCWCWRAGYNPGDPHAYPPNYDFGRCRRRARRLPLSTAKAQYHRQRQQPTAHTADQLNREEFARHQSDNGYPPYYWGSGSPWRWRASNAVLLSNRRVAQPFGWSTRLQISALLQRHRRGAPRADALRLAAILLQVNCRARAKRQRVPVAAPPIDPAE
jgi:hypothetical protein